ncbi:hypothetical protein AD998_00215 [bacterium 336/3]|nr:hypothetical protein AD998_00215 [bacterium 336/3]
MKMLKFLILLIIALLINGICRFCSNFKLDYPEVEMSLNETAFLKEIKLHYSFRDIDRSFKLKENSDEYDFYIDVENLDEINIQKISEEIIEKMETEKILDKSIQYIRFFYSEKEKKKSLDFEKQYSGDFISDNN